MNITAAFLGGMSAAVERAESIDPRWLLPALSLQLASLAFLGFAWRNILTAVYPGRVPRLSIVGAYAAGAALNGFAPARAGEGAKVALAHSRISGSKVATVASSLSVLLLIDGVLGLSLVGLLWATGVVPTLPLPSPPSSGVVPIAVCAVLLAAGAGIAARCCFARVRSFLVSLVDGLAVLRSPTRYLGTVLPFQVGAWLCRVGVVYVVFRAFHIEAALSTVVLVVVLNGASTAVPAPGGGGSQQILSAYALRGTLSAAGAVSFSLALQIGVTAVNTAVGLAAALVLVRRLPLAALRRG